MARGGAKHRHEGHEELRHEEHEESRAWNLPFFVSFVLFVVQDFQPWPNLMEKYA
jgi:hypothetical protein